MLKNIGYRSHVSMGGISTMSRNTKDSNMMVQYKEGSVLWERRGQ